MGLFDFFSKKKTQISDEDRQQLAEEMSANANLLVKQFKDNTILDYSVESLKSLDLLIEENSEFYKGADNETKRKMIIKIGSYIFEVARKNFGGQYYWYNRLDQPILVSGQPEFEMSLLSYEKVKGRFENGYEDNIPSFFEGYIEGIKKKSSQMIV